MMAPVTVLRLLAIFTCLFAIAATPVEREPTTQTAVTAPAAASTMPAGVDDDIPPPFLIALVLIVVAVALCLLGVGLAVGFAVMSTVAVLVFFGLLSTSFFVGVKERRVESGLRAFVIQAFAVAGAVLGAFAFYVAAWMLKVDWSIQMTLLAGVLTGAAVGVAVGLLLNVAWAKVRVWIVSRATLMRND